MFSSPLLDRHTVRHQGDNSSSFAPIRVDIQPCQIPSLVEQECLFLAQSIVAHFGGQAGAGEALRLITGPMGNVAHEVGTLRMGSSPTQSVVNDDCRVFPYGNLYCCDLSVFPTSPAANPTLTLVALALRLADHIALV